MTGETDYAVVYALVHRAYMKGMYIGALSTAVIIFLIQWLVV
jgi:hypothetical protein